MLCHFHGLPWGRGQNVKLPKSFFQGRTVGVCQYDYRETDRYQSVIAIPSKVS